MVEGAGAGFRRELGHKVRLAVAAAGQLGAATTASIVRNSVTASVGELHRRLSAASLPGVVAPGRLEAFEPVTGVHGAAGACCRFSQAELEVFFLAPDVVRLSWGPDDEPLPYATSAWPGAGCEVEVSGQPATGCVVSSEALEIEVGPRGSVLCRHPGGELLRRDLPPLRRGAQRSLRSTLRQGEVVSGLGEAAAGVDRRGRRFELWNRDPGGSWGPGRDPLYCPVPVLVGLHPRGDVLTFFENSYRGVVTLDGHGPPPPGGPGAEVCFSGGMLRYYVMVGPLPRLLERFTELTGRPSMAPRWAFGYHQCRWGYRSEADVEEVAAGFEAEDLPLSAIHLDIDYMAGYRVFTVDPGRFPDLRRVTSDLARRSTRLVTIVDPGVKIDGDFDLYRQGLCGDRFVKDPFGRPAKGVVWPGPSVFPDFTDEETRRWWGEQYRGLLDAGVAGFWHDMNEPTSITIFGDPTLPPTARHRMEGRGGSHLEAHNLYGLLMDRAGHEALAAQRPRHRPFVVSRSGWAGLQRWAWLWTGDVESSWAGLRQQVPTIVALGLSGIPFCGPDIGGFNGVPSPELFVRWLELSVTLPYCRTHAVVGAPPREPWRFPEPYRSAVGRLIRFRYRFLPFLYTLAEEACRTGHPMVRPLWWPRPGSEGARPPAKALDDSFLLGDAVLVAPLGAPVAPPHTGGLTVEVPAGSWRRWHPMGGDHDGGAAPVDGPGQAHLEASLGEPVLLVRQGSILPLDDAWASGPARLSLDHRPLRPALHIWPDASGRADGTVYDDEGDGFGPWRRTTWSLEPDGSVFVLTASTEGDFPAPPALTVVLHGLGVAGAEADGRTCRPEATRDGARIHCPGSFRRLTIRRDPLHAPA